MHVACMGQHVTCVHGNRPGQLAKLKELVLLHNMAGNKECNHNPHTLAGQPTQDKVCMYVLDPHLNNFIMVLL